MIITRVTKRRSSKFSAGSSSLGNKTCSVKKMLRCAPGCRSLSGFRMLDEVVPLSFLSWPVAAGSDENRSVKKLRADGN